MEPLKHPLRGSRSSASSTLLLSHTHPFALQYKLLSSTMPRFFYHCPVNTFTAVRSGFEHVQRSFLSLARVLASTYIVYTSNSVRTNSPGLPPASSSVIIEPSRCATYLRFHVLHTPPQTFILRLAVSTSVGSFFEPDHCAVGKRCCSFGYE